MTTASRKRARGAFDVAAYAAEAEEFLGAVGEEYFLHHSGQSPELALEPIYERHGGLFTRERIDALAELAHAGGADADGAEDDDAHDADNATREARLLLEFAVDGYLQRAVAPLTQRIAETESSATLSWRGERLTYRSAPVRIAQTPDRAERNALDSVYVEAMEAINPLREERVRALHELARELGEESYVALYSRVKGIDFDRLGVSLQVFLAESETVYFAALRRYLARIDIEQGDASRADLAHVLRGQIFDPLFPANRLVPTLTETLRGLGIDIARQPNVTLDLQPRPNKTPRAWCVAVRVPGDVRLSVRPTGGDNDYAALLHEAGHLEHYAGADAELPVAMRYLGDNSLTEAYAFLLEYLMHEPAWLSEQLGVMEGETLVYLDFAAFRKLYQLRRYVAKLLHELRLHRGLDLGLARAYYAGVLSFLVGVRYPESAYLADLDDGLYAGQYLRAWMLEGSISTALRTLFGPTWWRTPAAGEHLRERWSEGQRWTAEEVVASLWYDGLDWRPVLRGIRTHLVGEMSGYGGPNITTRAGTRKV